MLCSLTIENIALIDKLEIELGEGLNILSGETGAGKSIIIDSLNFVLGERADKSLIRYGTEFAVVQAVFSNYDSQAVCDYLSGLGIESEDILIVRRKMTLADGKNECRINGKLATLSTLKGLTELLVDIHGQHEHQSLLKPSNHIELLDSLGESNIAMIKLAVKDAHKNYHNLRSEFNRYGDEKERARKLDILSYQIDEIEKADIQESEEDELLEKRKRIRNMEKILTALQSAKDTLDGYGGSSVSGNIKNTISTLSMIANFDEKIAELQDRLYGAKAEVVDVSDTISDMLSELNFDSQSADKIEERLDIVRNLQRKYGGSYKSLQIFLTNSKTEAETLANAADRVQELERLITAASTVLKLNSCKLSDLRLKIANAFEQSMLKELCDLGMSGSTFKVFLQSSEDIDAVTSNGADTIEFLISPNLGEPLKPLAKIISGGEMSRFMLALKNIVANIDQIGTMVFDEIDTGISGNISAVVAEKMCNISRNRQVVAVTHMPSLASMADFHYLIEKTTANGKTLTHVGRLEDDTKEIARLIGGSDYSEHALPHAKEMKGWADRYKSNIAKPL